MKRKYKTTLSKANIDTNTVLEEESRLLSFENVKTTTRFLHYVVDFIFIFIFASNFTQLLSDIFGSGRDFDREYILINLGWVLATIFYYITAEKLFGLTFGKIVANSRVVKENGSQISWTQSFIRTFSRLVPFEFFSTFTGYPWHDQWSNTFVVNEDVEFEHDLDHQNTEVMNSNQ